MTVIFVLHYSFLDHYQLPANSSTLSGSFPLFDTAPMKPKIHLYREVLTDLAAVPRALCGGAPPFVLEIILPCIHLSIRAACPFSDVHLLHIAQLWGPMWC